MFLNNKIVLYIAFSFEKINEFFHILCLNKTDKFSVFCHSHERISFTDFEHIANIFWDDYLSLGPDSDRTVHLDSDACLYWNVFLGFTEHNMKS